MMTIHHDHAMTSPAPLVAVACFIGVLLLTACAAVGVVATSDPAKQLRDAQDLFDYAGRPLPAEQLIVDAVAAYQKSNDMVGLADAYRVYGLFFRSRSLSQPNYAVRYRDKGFLDRSATLDGRYEKSIEYFQRAAELLKSTERFDLLSNVYFHIGDDYVLIHDADKACRAFDQSIAAHAEFDRRHSGYPVDVPKEYQSFNEAIDAAKQATGCPSSTTQRTGSSTTGP